MTFLFNTVQRMKRLYIRLVGRSVLDEKFKQWILIGQFGSSESIIGRFFTTDTHDWSYYENLSMEIEDSYYWLSMEIEGSYDWISMKQWRRKQRDNASR